MFGCPLCPEFQRRQVAVSEGWVSGCTRGGAAPAVARQRLPWLCLPSRLSLSPPERPRGEAVVNEVSRDAGRWRVKGNCLWLHRNASPRQLFRPITLALLQVSRGSVVGPGCQDIKQMRLPHSFLGGKCPQPGAPAMPGCAVQWCLGRGRGPALERNKFSSGVWKKIALPDKPGSGMICLMNMK